MPERMCVLSTNPFLAFEKQWPELPLPNHEEREVAYMPTGVGPIEPSTQNF
jgi:hypothetical protein